MSSFPEYTAYDGLGLAELVRQGEVTPAELVETAIAQIERFNPQVNAVIHKLYDDARAATTTGSLPAGPFHGVPFLVKDLVSTYAGAPMRLGSRFYQDYVPAQDAEIILRYKQAGLVIVGKTNTPEFGLTPYTEPTHFGPTRNPWDLTRTAGGSSGGSAAAVAVGLAPLAGGGDGGGSIRIPAACCGLFGFKPTRGRTPTGPEHGEVWHGFVAEHVITRSVRDSAAMLDAIGGPDPGAPYSTSAPARPFLSEVGTVPGRLRIAFTSKPFLGQSVHPDCQHALINTIKLLNNLGHEVVEDAPKFDGFAFAKAFLTLVCADTAADIRRGESLLQRKATAGDFEVTTWALHLLGQQLSGVEVIEAKRYLQSCARQIGQFFTQYDLLVTPTLAEPPVRHGALQPKASELLVLKLMGRLRAGALLKAAKVLDSTAATVFNFTPYTPVFNVTGQPAMSVPLEWNRMGLPIGLHFVGRFGEDATLFRLASQLEQAQPWFARTPPLAKASTT